MQTKQQKIVEFILSLEPKLKDSFKEWVYTTIEFFERTDTLTDKQLNWIRTTAKYQNKKLPVELIDMFPQIAETQTAPLPPPASFPTHTTAQTRDWISDAIDGANSRHERDVLVELLSDMAAALLKASKRLSV